MSCVERYALKGEEPVRTTADLHYPIQVRSESA
jgi:hypothetical protein